MVRLSEIIKKEKNLSANIIGAFLVKGASMILNLFTMPAYMRYFQDDAILGIWFTMLSVLNWIMMFDLGIGNGLRNKLAETMAQNNRKEAKEYISSAYLIISALSLGMCIIFAIIHPIINWNSFLNISESRISQDVLGRSMSIVVYGIFVRFILALINSIIYSIQKSAVNNLLVFITNLSIFIYVYFAPSASIESNLINMAYCQVLFSNLPLLIVTLIIFTKELKGLGPNPKYYKAQKAKEVLNIGLVLLWLQIIAMIVLSTHSFFITRFTSPEQVVNYNIYYRVYNTIASIIVLALTPVWSAVTKAQAENNFLWIKRLYKICLVLPIVTLFLDLLSIPFLQWFFNIWLKENTINVEIGKVIVMIAFSVLFVLHYVNININNGLSAFKTQTILMTIAAVFMIPLCRLMCNITGDWTGVLIGCSLSILPYQLIQPFTGLTYLKKLELENKNQDKGKK